MTPEQCWKEVVCPKLTTAGLLNLKTVIETDADRLCRYNFAWVQTDGSCRGCAIGMAILPEAPADLSAESLEEWVTDRAEELFGDCVKDGEPFTSWFDGNFYGEYKPVLLTWVNDVLEARCTSESTPA